MAKAAKTPRLIHSPDTKAEVIDKLCAGSTCAELSRTYNIPIATIYDWFDSLSDANKKAIKRQENRELRDLVKKLIQSQLNNIISINDFTSQNEQWKQKQNAEGLAKLKESSAQSAIELIEVMFATDED